jgi:antitoxin (DNA-binding transcriptional repressor) of toxin-antitoxin stability system
MVQTITIKELKDRAGELLAGLRATDEIIVSEGGTPVAKIQALPRNTTNRARESGFWSGQIATAPDFDAPLPDSFWLGEQ